MIFKLLWRTKLCDYLLVRDNFTPKSLNEAKARKPFPTFDKGTLAWRLTGERRLQLASHFGLPKGQGTLANIR
jgi:hypothetical protein